VSFRGPGVRSRFPPPLSLSQQGHADTVGHGRFWLGQAVELREPILARAWNPARGALTGALDGDELDASLLLLAELGPVAATDLRFVSICNAIGRELCRNGRIMRYTNDDGFGAPETAFLGIQLLAH